MRSSKKTIKDYCRVVSNNDGDRFVGIKIDSDNIEVCFPIGYHLPDTETEIRADINNLIRTLSEFSPKKSSEIHSSGSNADDVLDFPIDAYLEVIRYYLEHHSYYKDKEPRFLVSDRGKTDWAKTIKRQKPLFQQNGSPVYIERVIRFNSPRENQYITEIHKYCVYESFQKIGWLFTQYVPEKSAYKIDHKRAVIELKSKISQTNDDKTRKLFSSMIAMLSYVDKNTDTKQAYFGTDSFEYIWEKVIDRVFGIPDKTEYFPRAKWHISGSSDRIFDALYPDTIMKSGSKIYVLDAKYYRFGITNNIMHLPEGSSIHKQITYGEYINSNDKFIDKKTGEHPIVFNAFILPFDAQSKNENVIKKFGEATGEWRVHNNTYDTVHGILIDTRYLLKNYTGNNAQKVNALASIIER